MHFSCLHCGVLAYDCSIMDKWSCALNGPWILFGICWCFVVMACHVLVVFFLLSDRSMSVVLLAEGKKSASR